MKKKLAALLCACMFVTSVSLPVYAEELREEAPLAEEVEVPVEQVTMEMPENPVEAPEIVVASAEYTYTLNGSSEATITAYVGTGTVLTIPGTIDGYTVVSIGSDAFKGNTEITEVVISDNVTTIGSGAFMKCSNLSGVTLPKTLEVLGKQSFYDCDKITSIEIPKSLKQADKDPNGHGPFQDCDGLKEVTFEEGIESIVSNLFAYCTGIKEVTIPDSVTSIGTEAFKQCSNLSEVVMGINVEEIGSNAFASCVNLSDITLPKTLEVLGTQAFYDCDKIISIEIPKSLKQAERDGSGHGPFHNCDGLTEVTFEEGIESIVSNLFAYCTGIKEVTIPDSVTSIGTEAFKQCSNLSEVVMGINVEEIGSNAFASCVNLSDITLPKTLEVLGRLVFYNCDKITSIEIPKSLKQVESDGGERGPFSDCDGLKEVAFEEGIESILPNLFAYCTGIEEITIPDTVTSIGSKAFRKCSNLSEVAMSVNVETIGSHAFANCEKLSDITLPKTLEVLGRYTFYDCDKITSIEIPKNLKQVESDASEEGPFSHCDGLKEVAFEEGIESVLPNLFAYCTGIEEITIPDTVRTIGESAFEGCAALENVVLSKRLETLEKRAFSDCDAITTIVLPYSVNTMGERVFAKCDNLQSVIFPGALTSIPKYTFADSPEVETVTMSRRITSVGDNVFKSTSGLLIYGVEGTYAKTYADSVQATFAPYTAKASNIALTDITLTMEKNDTAVIGLTVSPENFTDEVKWESSDAKVVEVAANGRITAKNVGSATIKVTVGSKIASCAVTVFQPVLRLSLAETSLTMEERSTYSLAPVIVPANATNKTLSWTSSDESIVTVDANGKITAKAAGTATITATTTDGTNLSASCELTVHEWNVFCDVAINSWMYPYAKFAFERGLITGKGTNEEGRTIFDPNTAMTRAEFVQVLYSKEGKPAVEYKATFTDVKDKDWFDSAVIWANDNGIVSGNGVTFDPYGKITREQMAAIFYKYAVYKGYDVSGRKELTGFEDTAKVSSWALNSLQWALEEGIMTGAGTKLNPLESATRAQAATMMKSFMVAYEGVEK